MIFKKALIGLLLAGGAVTLVACGKNKDKKTTGTTTTGAKTTAVKTTASQTTTAKQKSNINYTKDINLSNLKEKKLSLKEQAKVKNATFKLSFSSAKGESIESRGIVLEDSLVKMVMIDKLDAKVYSNDVATINEENDMKVEGNIPAMYQIMIPSNTKSSSIETIAATNNYVFSSNKTDGSSYLSNPYSDIDEKSSTYDILEDVVPSSMLRIINLDGDFYEIDDKNFVLHSIDYSPSNRSGVTVYDPKTNTSTSNSSITLINKNETVCYYSIKDNGEYQLDYVYAFNSTSGEYAQRSGMYSPLSNTYVKLYENAEISMEAFEFKLGYETKTEYADKASFINSFTSDLSLNNIYNKEYDSSFSYQYNGSCDIDVLTTTSTKINFDFAATLSKDDIVNLSVEYTNEIINEKVLKDEALESSESITDTNGGYIIIDLDSISALKNVEGIEIVEDSSNNKYIKVNNVKDGYDYQLIINADLEYVAVTKEDNTVEYQIKVTVKSSELIEVVQSNSGYMISPLI